jgi:hypothetical protein
VPTALLHFHDGESRAEGEIPYGLKSRTMIQLSEAGLTCGDLARLTILHAQARRPTVHNHGMKANLKPALERGQISFRRPNLRCAIPTVELFFKYVSDAFPQILQRLIQAVAFRHQVDRRLLL